MADKDTQTLFNLVDKMSDDNAALFEAIMFLDSKPTGRRLRLIREVTLHNLKRKLENDKISGRKDRIKELNDFYEAEAREQQEESSEGEARSEQQEEDSGTGSGSDFPFETL